MLDMIGELNRRQAERNGDAEVLARVAQYEMAYRMQTSVPELTDFRNESAATLNLYGPDVHKPGTYAYNCLMARRMAERGVRFIQLYHRGWDHHGSVPHDLPLQCQDVDQPQAGLLRDLRQRGLLDETLVVWGGEFGRTVFARASSPQRNTAAITIRAASACGLPAEGSSPASRTAKPMTSRTTSPKTP